LGFGNKPGIHNLGEKERVIAGADSLNDLAFKIGNAIFQDRAPCFSPLPLKGIEFGLGIGTFESFQKIRLVAGHYVQGKAPAFLNQLMRIAIGVHRRHDQQWIVGDLGNPGGNHPVDFFFVK
jgi:hypothetical protein